MDFNIESGCFWGLLRKKSLGEILFKMLPTARNQSSEFKRNLDGFFLVASQEILGGNLFLVVASQKIIHHLGRQLI